MCGRVSRNSLFHELALRETFFRDQLTVRREEVMRAADAWKAANSLVNDEEPLRRAEIECDRERAESDVWLLCRRVLAYYRRRDVEHAESSNREQLRRVENDAASELFALIGHV
jgi:hypothetical protein